MEYHMCFVTCPECWGVDAGHEFLLIFGNAFETKKAESGEDRAFWWRQLMAFPVKVRLGGSEYKGEKFETEQQGEGSSHLFG